MLEGAAMPTASPQIVHSVGSTYYMVQYRSNHWFACPTPASKSLNLKYRYWDPKTRPGDRDEGWSDYIPIREMRPLGPEIKIARYKEWLKAAMEACHNNDKDAALEQLDCIFRYFGKPGTNSRLIADRGYDFSQVEEPNSFMYVNRYHITSKNQREFKFCTYKDGDGSTSSDGTGESFSGNFHYSFKATTDTVCAAISGSSSDSSEDASPRRPQQAFASARPPRRSRPRSPPASERAARQKRPETPSTSASEDLDRLERSRRRQERRGPNLLDLEGRWRSLEQRMRVLNERYDEMEQHVSDLQRQMRRMQSQANEAQAVEDARRRMKQLVKSDRRIRDEVRRLKETVRYLQNQINYAAHAPPHPQYPQAQPSNVQQHPPQVPQTQQSVPPGGSTNA